MDFCNFISNVTNVGRFVSFAAKWHWSEKRCVSFEQNFVKWQLSDKIFP